MWYNPSVKRRQEETEGRASRPCSCRSFSILVGGRNLDGSRRVFHSHQIFPQPQRSIPVASRSGCLKIKSHRSRRQAKRCRRKTTWHNRNWLGSLVVNATVGTLQKVNCGIHMQMVHRRFVSEKSTVPPGATQSDSPEHQLGTSREKWAELSVQLRNRVQAQFKPEELDAIDRFILIASPGSIFDHLYR